MPDPKDKDTDKDLVTHKSDGKKHRWASQDVADLDQSQDVNAAKAASKAARAKEKHDIKARVVGNSVVDESWVDLMIGSGSEQGITEGMTGYLITPDGKRHEEFKVFNVSDRICHAKIHTTLDTIKNRKMTMINPSN